MVKEKEGTYPHSVTRLVNSAFASAKKKAKVKNT